MKGPFSLKYMLTGSGVEDWYKSWGLGLRLTVTLLLLLLLCVGVRALFTKKSTQSIIAKPGSHVQVTQVNKQSRFLIPFIEGGVEQNNREQMGTYIRAGVRVEF